MNGFESSTRRNEAGLSDKEFRRLSEFIYDHCGIKMPPVKKTMLEARMQKRLRQLGMSSFTDYCEWILDPEQGSDELVHFIDIVTTNKTDFFREPSHFEYLVQTAIPELIRSCGAGVRKKLMVWSAGCSSGEEPYTLSMVLSEFAEHYPGFNFNYVILGTDISTRMLEKGKTAIYEMEKAEGIPMQFKKKYLLRSKDRANPMVRIVPELRSQVRFRWLNFMDADLGLREPMDIIFCRNVIIYFDRETQERLLNKFCRYLTPGGYVFIGHSETMNNMRVPLVQVAPTIYRLPG